MEIELPIPEDRIGVLIGREGEVKERIEKETNCRIDVDSETGTVKIKCDDPINFLRVQDIIKGIAHGFNPEVALKLLQDEMTVLEIIDLTSCVSPKHLERIKGRIIGKGGKMRKNIEDMLGVDISVYGKTVAIMGDPEAVNIAREAILMLVDGSQHTTVQRFLESRRRELKTRRLDWQNLP